MSRSDREEAREKYADPRKVAERRESGDWSSLTIPEGMKVFKIKKEGIYKLDILPYRVGNGNPFVDEGSIHYERTYYVHKQVGANNGIYTCSARSFKKACPICDYRTKLQSQPGADKDLIKSLNTQTKQIFLLIDHDHPEDGVQLWEMSHFNFGKLLDSRIRKADDSDGYHNFFHRRGGMTLRVEISDEKAGAGFTFLKATAIDFKPREDIDREVLKDLPCLDDLIKETSYKELEKIFLQAGPSDDDSKEETTTRRRHRKDDDGPENGKPRSRGEDDDDDPPSPRRRAEPEDDEPVRPSARSRRQNDDDDEPKGDEDEPVTIRPSRRSREDDDD